MYFFEFSKFFQKNIYIIGEDVFKKCRSLSSIIIKSKIPPACGELGIPLSYCSIFVPEEGMVLYKKDKQWRKYKKILKPMERWMWYESVEYDEDEELKYDEDEELKYEEDEELKYEEDEGQEYEEDDEEREERYMQAYQIRNRIKKKNNKDYEENDGDYEGYYDAYNEDYSNYSWYYEDYNWLSEVAGTDDPEVMNDVYWNID